MPFLSFAELQRVTGGQWLVPPENLASGVHALSDDSRHLPPGGLFLAIPGELTDGHRYVGAAVESGAGAVLLQNPPAPEWRERMEGQGTPCLQVASSLAAYQQLALWHRNQYPDTEVLAITGSCGKTSTKEMCAAILEQRFPQGVLKTQGSTNNHFGVPRNLFRIQETTRVAVIEMGTNHPGEIAGLVKLAPPRVGVVCNIGQAHLEAFHTLRGVAREKSSILQGVLPGGLGVYPADAQGADLLKAAAPPGVRLFSFGAKDTADLQYQYLGFQQGRFRVRLLWRWLNQERLLEWDLGGAHMAANAACAACAATLLGCTPDQAIQGLATCQLPGGRMELREKDGVQWVNDAFNANPTSVRASLDWFAEVAPSSAPQFLALGDMLEGGQDSLKAHREILEYARQRCPRAQLLLVGPLFAQAAAREPSLPATCFPTAVDLQEKMPPLPPGSWILLKSSHGIGLSRLAPS
ncbi:MAG: UDP-N-acetylmuramoyl-tripeptide--D-alanyl-D-alanine ligase [Oligosphaeraceae bacterium]